MNRPLGHILHASLLLVTSLIVGLLISRLSNNEFHQSSYDEEIGITTVTDTTRVPESIHVGKQIFRSHCASCHTVFKKSTGPALTGFEERGPWAQRENIYAWIKNPAAFMSKDPYTKALHKEYGAMMTAFPEMEERVIDAICDYISFETKNQVKYISKK